MTDEQIQSTEAWAAFVEMRKAKGKRAPFTDLARKRILFELRSFAADGQDVETILWTSVTNGWSGVFPAKRIPFSAPTTREGPKRKVEDISETERYLAEQKAHRDEVAAQRLKRANA